MADPEIKILRDKRAKLIAKSKKLQAAILDMQDALDHREGIIAELSLKSKTLKRQLQHYDSQVDVG